MPSLYEQANVVLAKLRASSERVVGLGYIVHELQEIFGSEQNAYRTIQFLEREQKVAVQKLDGKPHISLIPEHLTKYIKTRMQSDVNTFMEINEINL